MLVLVSLPSPCHSTVSSFLIPGVTSQMNYSHTGPCLRLCLTDCFVQSIFVLLPMVNVWISMGKFPGPEPGIQLGIWWYLHQGWAGNRSRNLSSVFFRARAVVIPRMHTSTGVQQGSSQVRANRTETGLAT